MRVQRLLQRGHSGLENVSEDGVVLAPELFTKQILGARVVDQQLVEAAEQHLVRVPGRNKPQQDK